MCIIIYAPKGEIGKKQLRASLDNNPDGWGVMWPHEGKVQIVQGMADKEFFYHWKWIRNIKGPKVFHARIGTHGVKTIDNCHPFMIPGHNLAVAHNGIIRQQSFKGDDSDTKNFVNNILARLPTGFQKMYVYQELLSDYVGFSKLVFMDGTGNVEILNADQGKWMYGNWYSNNSYRPWIDNSCGFKGGKYSKDEVLFPSGVVLRKKGDRWEREDSKCNVIAFKEDENYHVPVGAPDGRLPEHYKNIGASKGLTCTNP